MTAKMTAKHIDYASPKGRKLYKTMAIRFRLGMLAEFLVVAIVFAFALCVSVGAIMTTYQDIAATADKQGQAQRVLDEWHEDDVTVDGKSRLYVRHLRSQDLMAIEQEGHAQ